MAARPGRAATLAAVYHQEEAGQPAIWGLGCRGTITGRLLRDCGYPHEGNSEFACACDGGDYRPQLLFGDTSYYVVNFDQTVTVNAGWRQPPRRTSSSVMRYPEPDKAGECNTGHDARRLGKRPDDLKQSCRRRMWRWIWGTKSPG